MWGKATETETSQAGEATTNQPNNQPTKQAYKACKIWDRGKEHSKSFVYRSCSASGVPSSSDVPRYMRLMLPTTLLIFFYYFLLYFIFFIDFSLYIFSFLTIVYVFTMCFLLAFVWATKKYCFIVYIESAFNLQLLVATFPLLCKSAISCFVYTCLLCCRYAFMLC